MRDNRKWRRLVLAAPVRLAWLWLGYFQGLAAAPGPDQNTQLVVPSGDQIAILAQGASNEFAIPIQAINELAPPSADQPGRLARIQGVVTKWRAGHEFTVKDRTGTVQVQTQLTNQLANDPWVDVVGRLVPGPAGPELIGAKYRRLGFGLATPADQLSQHQRLSLTGSPLQVLDRVELVRRLDNQEAARGYPVEISGVITYYDPTGDDCFVQDGTAGIWIETQSTPQQGLDLQPGDFVAVEGYSAPGYAPCVVRPHFQILGRSELPEGELLTLSHLQTGREDGQWVKFIGLVRSAEGDGESVFLNLEASNGGRLKAIIAGLTEPAQLKGLVAGTIQAQGVCATLVNHKRQLIGVQLLVPNTNQLHVLSQAPLDPAALPLRFIRDLMQFQQQTQHEKRVRVSGVVMLLRSSRSLFIHDSSDGIYVQTQDEVHLKPGDTVEVVGFPSIGEFSPVIQNAVCLRTGTGPLPPVLSPSMDEVLKGSLDSELIRIEATLLDQTAGPDDTVLTLQAQNRVFDADLPKGSGQKPLRWLRPGIIVRLTGVCSVQVDENRQPKAFRLLLRGPEDVELVKTPMAWILPYAYRLVAALSTLSLFALFWVAMLRSRVRHQTELIRQRMLKESALEERFRDLFENANDLVFSLDLDGQWLSLNKAVERVLGRSKSEIAAQRIFDFIVPAHRNRVRAMIERLQAGKPSGTEEIEILDTSGQPVILEVSARVSQNETAPSRLDCIARNITDRKRAEAELSQTQAELLRTSRLAGMAEVATSVLHNVGNILNSVNVSAGLVADQVRHSKAGNIGRVGDLLCAHLTDLGNFLCLDPQGKQVPTYLRDLGEHLSQERAALLKEVASLRSNVAHMKEIVARQQEYAKVSGVTESVKVVDLIEDALQMNAAALARHGVKVVREYHPQLSEINVEKHKVLQILVNLIQNSEYACGASGREDKRVILRATQADDRVRIAVIDNGVGIAPGNLTRIFSHGFTTRKDGHGFGLHSGALAAKELGGALHVFSDGPGHGAAFTLELPLQPRQETPASSRAAKVPSVPSD